MHLTRYVPLIVPGVQYLLTVRMRKHVENDWKGVPRAQLKTYRSRLRAAAIQSLIDLALIAEREPEDQLTQIFTPTTLNPLIRALTGHGCYRVSTRHYEIAKAMLATSITRLQALIDPEYQPIIIPSIEKDAHLLRMLPIPTSPRQGLEIPSPNTVKAQRQQSQRERKSASLEYQRNQLLPNETTKTKDQAAHLAMKGIQKIRESEQ